MKLMNAKMESFKKGSWSPDEDKKLSDYIKRYGIWNWSLMPKAAGLSRSGKSCRLRWMNYLKPSLKRECYNKEEIQTIIKLHASLGNKWSKIAEMLPGRTLNGIKNFWHTHLKRMCKSNELGLVDGENNLGIKPKRVKHSKQKRTKSPTTESMIQETNELNSMLPGFETPQYCSSVEENFTSYEGNVLTGDLLIESFWFKM